MRFRLLLTMLGSIIVVVPAAAHHSHGIYVDSFTDIRGTVKEVHLLLPHSWVYLDVKDRNGIPHVWVLEATGRERLERVGITKSALSVGDPVKVRCHVMRDGLNGCLLGFLKDKTGAVRDWDGNNAPIPADF